MRWLFVTLLATLLACSATKDPEVFGESKGGGGTSASTSSTSTSLTATGTSTGLGGDFNVGGGGGSAPVGPAEVFGHGPSVLYKLDPLTKVVTVVGNFTGCSSVIDLAIDKNSLIFATTFSGLYKIDKNTAACTHISSGSYPNSLSFVPEGTVDQNEEALVGYNGSTYVRIDTVNGNVTQIGSLGSGYASSGDIVSVIKGGTFLTVTGSGCGDCLVEVNPTTGAMIKNWGPVGHSAVYGLAYWGGSAYGFSNAGQLFEINFGQDLVTSTVIAIPAAPPNLQFWGAGSSTDVPVEPPT